MAIIRREIRKRGFLGNVFKFLLIAFNVIMLGWLISYWVDISQLMQNTSSGAEKIGANIGATLGTSTLLFFWIAGDLILGLLTFMTQGSKILIEEETGPNGEIKRHPNEKDTRLVFSAIGLGAFVILLSVIGQSANNAEIAANTADVSASLNTTPAKPSSVNNSAVEQPSASAGIRQQVIARCRNQMGQYGASLVKACVDQDLEALAAIQSYPKQDQQIIERCWQQMGQYGYNLVKTCVDQDVEADTALQHY